MSLNYDELFEKQDCWFVKSRTETVLVTNIDGLVRYVREHASETLRITYSPTAIIEGSIDDDVSAR